MNISCTVQSLRNSAVEVHGIRCFEAGLSTSFPDGRSICVSKYVGTGFMSQYDNNRRPDLRMAPFTAFLGVSVWV